MPQYTFCLRTDIKLCIYTKQHVKLFLCETSCTRHALQCQSKTPLPLDIA
jgi:hypothetical protein